MPKSLIAEEQRLEQARVGVEPWKKWGPYLAERQWGTVREDYSDNGNAWDYFSHDQARSRAYRWGEDGLAGISDDKQFLCFALALWNGKDPILKERLFGLTNSEGNHGEDVKEYYFYLDSTPTHSHMKYLYKYPQAAYPYVDLIETNRRRGRQELEYELSDHWILAATPIVFHPLEHDVFARLPFLQSIRSGAQRRAIVVDCFFDVSAFEQMFGKRAAHELGFERGVAFSVVNYRGQGIWRIDGRDAIETIRTLRLPVWIVNGVDRELHVRRREWLTVMPLDVRTEFPGDVHAAVGSQLNQFVFDGRHNLG